MTKQEMRKLRINLVKEMHLYVIDTGDEELYDCWFAEGVPDDPSEEDFEFFADEHSFKELCELFGKLMDINEREDY